ncbi:unknown [Firmicutes bacterium CAG:114]|nr:unknown [Firmicutes bacterium CAG:114]
MGDIGGELPPQALPLLSFGDIHHENHRAGHLPVGSNRTGQNLEDVGLAPHQGLGMAAGQGFARGLPDLPPAGPLPDALGLLLLPQQVKGALIAGEHMVTAVDEQNPFAHVLRQGGKLPLPAAQGVHLPANGAVLLPQAADQGKELLIGLIQPGVFQIQAVDGFGNLPRQPGGQNPRQDEGQHQNPQHRLENPQNQRPHRGLHTGNPQNRPVRQTGGIVEILLQQGVGEVFSLSRALLHRLPDLRPVPVVLHGGGVCHTVIEHGAVGVHPGQALGGPQTGQVGLSALLHAVLHIGQLLLELLIDLLLILGGHHRHEKPGTQDHHRQPHQEAAAENLARHEAPPIL